MLSAFVYFFIYFGFCFIFCLLHGLDNKRHRQRIHQTRASNISGVQIMPLNVQKRRRRTPLLGFCTQAKVSTIERVINCVSKKKGHLSATLFSGQQYERGGIYMWLQQTWTVLGCRAHLPLTCTNMETQS